MDRGISTLCAALVLLPCAVCASGKLAAVDVALEVPSGSAVSVWIRHADGETGKLVEAPWRGVIQLESADAQDLIIVADGYWVDKAAASEGAGDGLVFRLYEQARVTGDLLIPAGGAAKTLEKLRIRFSVSVSGDVRVGGSVECPVDGVFWSCLVPAGRADLRLGAEGYQPTFFWEVSLGAESETKLETLRLVFGGAISGYLVADVRELPLSEMDIVVEALRSHTALPAKPEELGRFELLGASTTADEGGRFRIGQLAPGPYKVRARAGFELASREVSVAVPLDAKEVVLPNPLELFPSAQLDLFLSPEVDPLGEPWEIHLARANGNSQVLTDAGKGQASLAGHWSVGDLSPGSFKVSVNDSQGSTWLREEIELEPGESLVAFEIEIVPVRGSIALGDEPIAATVIFGTHNGIRSLSMTSDDSGVFQGAVPSEGEWPIEVQYPGVRGRQNAGVVDVRLNPKKGYASVEIELNDNRISGHVTLDDEPVKAFVIGLPGEVRGEGPRKQFVVESESDGRFELVGLPEGPIRVYAYTGEATSATWRQFEVGKRTVIEDLELELQVQSQFRGRLFSNGAPVAGALIVPLSEGLMPDTLTFADGRFVIKASGSAQWVDIVVVPPEKGVLLYRLRRQAEEIQEVILELPTATGDLIVDPRTASLSYHGVLVPFDHVARALIRSNRFSAVAGGLLLSGVAEGVWEACRARNESGIECNSASVLSGSQVRLVFSTEEVRREE